FFHNCGTSRDGLLRGAARQSPHQQMPQIFHRSANTISKLSLAGALMLAAGLILLAMLIGRSSYVTRANEYVEQPVQFSHIHHVLDDGIDCRYCHTSVETSSFAGIPPTKTCMNCHSQIWSNAPILEPVRASFRDDRPLRWVRVHDLPDFVYFNHSIHVKKGMGCETCHGRVDQMPLMQQVQSLQMEWCLDCHRNPEKYVRPRSEVFTMNYRPAVPQSVQGPMLVKEYGIKGNTSCSTCHR
ncbi:MAG TPA: cytochrome c3 family protein, partial [Vicinamibacterales bacterium]|nr:cytochrome c3 family protein [Vicinamibacterales bacterium]